VSAQIVLASPSDTVELIAHELEHLIEQLDGADVSDRRVVAGTHSSGHAYESGRAIEAGQRVAREVDSALCRWPITPAPGRWLCVAQ